MKTEQEIRNSEKYHKQGANDQKNQACQPHNMIRDGYTVHLLALHKQVP